jgi:hypothetical protein
MAEKPLPHAAPLHPLHPAPTHRQRHPTITTTIFLFDTRRNPSVWDKIWLRRSNLLIGPCVETSAKKILGALLFLSSISGLSHFLGTRFKLIDI